MMQSEIDIKKENQEILNKYRSLLRACAEKTNKEDKKLIRQAFNLALQAHQNVRRKSGEPYIYHPIAVAQIAAKEIGLGATSIACALLHDVVEDTSYSISDMEKMFGTKIAKIIDGLTKIDEVFDKNISQQAENFRKMLLTLSDDVRVILIKLADRLHNMRTLDSMPEAKQLKIASETSYLYAPLAHRLGLYAIKTELEDLSLKYTKPKEFKEIVRKLDDTKKNRERYIQRFTNPIKEVLKKEDIICTIKGRSKSIFSIHNKMKKKDIPFEEVFDKFAIRVVVDCKPEEEKAICWKVYSVVTDFYKPNPDRLRDWISTPKANGYESLHTTVMGQDGKWVEVQIRSERMDEIAEMGYAAHWKYKNTENKENSLDEWINKIRELLENPESNAIDFIDDFKLNLFAEEIYVFTPKGDLRTLPQDATALDFAFDIHTEIGLRCLGVKVNGRLVPLSYKLKSGDQVEVISSKIQNPKADWLNFVVTARAKSKIKTSLKEEKKKIGKEGKEKLERKLRHLKLNYNSSLESELLRFFHIQDSLELFFKVGTGSITNTELKEFVNTRGGWYSTIKNTFVRKKSPQIISSSEKKEKIIVFSEEQKLLDYKLAACCNPIPGDEIFGFTTVEEGIKVHKTNCPNAIQMRSNYNYRIISATWIGKDQIDFIAYLTINGIDRVGLMNNITKIISSQMNVNIKSINISSNDGIFEGEITLKVHNLKFLNTLIENLKNVDGLKTIHRIDKPMK